MATTSVPADVTGAYPRSATRPAYQAFQALQIGFVIAPLAAGVDKFFNFLTVWEKYLAPQVANAINPITFMRAVGIIEIAAAILVAVRPRIGAYIVCLWLLGIVGNLLMTGGYYDIALRDFGLAIGAFALARLSEEFDK
jgi:ABC-type transport system involved in cytochrome bd biosynthesis fused ATPase/permease subunit